MAWLRATRERGATPDGLQTRRQPVSQAGGSQPENPWEMARTEFSSPRPDPHPRPFRSAGLRNGALAPGMSQRNRAEPQSGSVQRRPHMAAREGSEAAEPPSRATGAAMSVGSPGVHLRCVRASSETRDVRVKGTVQVVEEDGV